MDVEPGFYWILYGDEWQPAEFVNDQWWVIGSGYTVMPEQIGPAIVRPTP